jgi:hypothetical protein
MQGAYPIGRQHRWIGRHVSQGTRRITSQKRSSCRHDSVAGQREKGRWNSSWACIELATAGSVQAAQVGNEAETGSGRPPV